MFDPQRDDSKATIEKANEKGVRVKMVTGDDTAIAIKTARQLDMGTHIIPAADIFPKDMDPNNVPPEIADAIGRADGFVRVFPEHKYVIVKALQARDHLVAMTGDGVNDAPALKLGVRVLSHPHLRQNFGLADQHQLQTLMFLQLVVVGHLLLFVTRTERWFLLPPYPAVPLVVAILLTQVIAVLMCGLGWLVPSIPWALIGWVWVYNIAWMLVLGGRLLTERFATYRTAQQVTSACLVNQPLRLYAA
jgi:magnesium-transporting ATPase (P-type)